MVNEESGPSPAEGIGGAPQQSWFHWAFHSCEAPFYFTLIATPVAMSVSHLRWGIRQKAMRVGKYTLATGLVLSLLNCSGIKTNEERMRAVEVEKAEERELKREQELQRKKQKMSSGSKSEAYVVVDKPLDSKPETCIVVEKPSWIQKATHAVLHSCELEAIGISALIAPVSMFGAHQLWKRMKTTVRVGQITFMMSLVVTFMNCASRKSDQRYQQRIEHELLEARLTQEHEEREMKQELEAKKKIIAELLEKQKAAEKK
uniref:HIG1 domain-containing protein n=1 Tax=Plectus sambesii TaxID=2011161 RepID=A0A914VE37_9BILA